MAVLDRSISVAVVGALALILLGGCATPSAPPHEVYTPVDVAVPVTCVPKALGPPPAGLRTPGQIAAITDGPSRYVAIAEDWLLRIERMNDTEPVIDACRTVPSSK